MSTISKSELGAELAVTKGRFSQYLREGMPALGDGLLDRDQCLNWLAKDSLGTAGDRARALLRGETSDRGGARRKKPPLPPFFESLEGIESPADSIAMVALFHMLRGIGAKATLAAYEAGAPKEVAQRAGDILTLMFVHEIEAFADGTGIKIPGGLMFTHPQNFDQVDWSKITEPPGAMALPAE